MFLSSCVATSQKPTRTGGHTADSLSRDTTDTPKEIKNKGQKKNLLDGWSQNCHQTISEHRTSAQFCHGALVCLQSTVMWRSERLEGSSLGESRGDVGVSRLVGGGLPVDQLV